LLIGTKQRRVVIGVGHSQLNVGDIDVGGVGVLHVHGQVEHGVQQRVVVNTLHNGNISFGQTD